MKIKKRSTSDLYKDDIYLITPFLDGRFKIKWISTSTLSTTSKERIANMIKTLVLKAALQLHGSTNNTSHSVLESSINEINPVNDNTPTCINLPGFKRKQLISNYEGERTSVKKTRSCISEAIESEISSFENEMINNADIIFVKKTTYPYLYLLATRMLCIPATSAPVERVFCASGIFLRPHRSRLSSNVLSMLTLLKCNRQLL